MSSQNRAPERKAIDISKVTAWGNHALVVTDSKLLHSTIKRSALSPSSGKAMSSCRARWVADRLLPQSDDPFAPAPLGTSAHTVLERLFEKSPDKRTPNDLMITLLELADEEYGTHVHGDALAEKQRWIQSVYEKCYRIHEMEDVYKVSVNATEAAVTDVEIGGVPFVGHIDRVDNTYDEDGNFLGVTLIDYKTGKAPTNLKFGDDHGDQMRLYKLAYEAKYGIEVVGCYLYYTAVPKVRRVPITKTATNKTLKAFKAGWSAHNKSVETANFDTKASALCGWCPLVNTCPSAIKPDGTAYVPRVEGIPSLDELRILALEDFDMQVESVYEVDEEPILFESDLADYNLDVPDSLSDLTEPALVPEPEHESTPDEFIPASKVIQNHEPGDLKEVGATSRRGRKNERNTMNNTLFAPDLDKPWDTLPADEVRIPANSPEATALFGLVSRATQMLIDNGRATDEANVRAAAGVLMAVVSRAEHAMSGNVDFTSGLNTRIRGVLFSLLDIQFPPFGQGADAVEAWMNEAVERIVLVSQTVAALHTRGRENPTAHTATRGANVLGAPQAEPEPAF